MTNTQKESIGQKIRKYRLERKLSQKQLSTGICTISAISQIESDKIRPTMELLGQLAERLAVDISNFVDVSELSADTDYLLAYTKLLIQKQQYEEALRIIEELHSLSQNQMYTVRLLRAECHMRLGDRTLATNQLNELLGEIQHNSSFDLFTLQANKTLGTVHYLQQDMIKSYHHYQVAYRISCQSDKVEPSVVADLMQNLGLVCNDLAKYEEAKSFLLMAHEFYEKVSNIRSLANTYYSLGVATKRADYMNRALEIYENLGIVRMSNMVRQYHAFHVKAAESYREAIDDLLDCSEQVYRLDDKNLSLYILTRALEVALANRDHWNATSILNLTQNRFGELDKPLHGDIAYYDRIVGKYFLFVENYEKAFEYGIRSAEMFDKIGMKEDASDSYQLIADSFLMRGLYKEAHEYQFMATQLLRKQRM